MELELINVEFELINLEFELINLELINLMWNWPNGIDPRSDYYYWDT